jgi:hypothetical protein
MNVFLLVGVLMLGAGQVESGPKLNPKAQSEARLKLMKETAARFEIHTEGPKPKRLELAAEPVLRWDNPRSFVVDGATFIWLSEQRPEVIGAMWFKNARAHFELHSLSPEPLSAVIDGDRHWSTSRPGIRWEGVPAAAPPPESRAKRLQQMKQLAQDFGVYAVKTAPEYDEGSTWRFRMMAQPIHRYAEEAAVDGAVFALVQGTDPEAFLLFESRTENGKARWHFAFAAGCGWELHGEHKGREVWFLPNRDRQDEKETVYGFVGPFAVDAKLFPPGMTVGNER